MTDVQQRADPLPAGAEIRDEATQDGATKVWLAIDGNEVSRAYIIPFTIHVGAATVRMDGIGGVATDDAHRKRGHSRRVLAAAVARMRAGDAALSTLYGIADFYPKFGYATLGPYHVIRLTRPSRIPDLPEGYEVRALHRDDVPTVLRLYEQTMHRLVGPIARHPASRSTRRLTEAVGRKEECRVIAHGADGIVAYLWRGSRTWWTEERGRVAPDALPVAEVIAADPGAADAALTAARRWAEEAGKAEIHFSAPLDDVVSSAAMLLDTRVESYYARDAEFMGRCLDPRRLLAALLPELSHRASQSPPDIAGRLHIATDEGSATLAIDGASVILVDEGADRRDDQCLTVRMPQHQLARLALGGFRPEDVLARLPEPPDDHATELVATLFPRRDPYIAPPDWF